MSLTVKELGEIKLPPLNHRYHYNKYVIKSILGKLPGMKPSWKLTQHIRDEVIAHFVLTSESEDMLERGVAVIEEKWPIVADIMWECPGLAQFMLDYGVHSQCFMPLLLDVPNAAATLPAYGKVRNIFGEIVDIPKNDPLYRFAKYDQMYQSLAFRNRFYQKYLMKAKTPVSLGAGGLPELWANGFHLNLSQKFTAYDRDNTLFERLHQVLGEDWQEKNPNINCVVGDFLQGDVQSSHDLVAALGTLSYYADDLEGFLNKMNSMRTTDGYLLVDSQCVCPEAIFDAYVLHWNAADPPMKPYRNPQEAYRKIREAAQTFDLEIIDYGSTNAAGIVFLLGQA